MNKTVFSIVTLCIGLMLLLNGCTTNNISKPASSGDETNNNQQFDLSPEQVAKNHFKALLYEDSKTLLDCLGVVKNEKSISMFKPELSEEIRKLKDKLSFSGFKYKVFSGLEKEIAMASISEDWLIKNVEFVYSLSDIKEIGRVFFTMSYEDERMEQWICVVKTNKGWFTASIDLY